MMAPPMMVHVRWRQRWPGGVWIPVVLLWPLALLVLVPAFLVGAAVAMAQGGAWRFWSACAAFYRMLCASRGLRVDVAGRRLCITISIH